MANKVVPFNQALTRFYPGGPLPKRPSRPYKSNKPIVFKDFDQYYEEFFDMIDKDANVVKFLGGYFQKELRADFSQSMKAQVSAPSKASAEDIPEEFAGDIHEMPGSVGASINLNPVDWIKKPQKEATTFVGDIIKGTFGFDIKDRTWNFSDVDASIEKDFVWGPLVRGESIGNSRLTKGFSKQNAFARILEDRLTGRSGGAVGGTGTGFSDAATADFLDYKTNEDSYIIGQGFVSSPTNPVSEAQSAFVTGMTSFQASGSREDNFTNIGNSFLKVLDAESRLNRPITYNVLDPTTQAFLQSRIDDIRGYKTPVVDVFGNDFLSITSQTANGYIKEREELLTKTIPQLKADIADLSSRIKVGDVPAELKKAKKALEKAEKRLPALDGKVHAAVTQLVAESPASFGAVNKVIDAIDSAGIADPKLTELSGTLKIFADPSVGVTKNIAALRHALFELDRVDPKETATISALNARIVALTGDLQAAGAAIQGQASSATNAKLKSLLDELHTSVQNPTSLNLSTVSALEAKIVGFVDDSVGETRKYLRDNAQISDGSLLFREQYNLLTNMHGFYDSFRKVENDLPKDNFKKGNPKFDAQKTSLIEMCDSQLKSFTDTRALLVKSGDPDALREFDTIFSSHLKAVEKLKSEATNVGSVDGITGLLRKYKSVYDTKTLGGGVGDKITRRFMESVYFTDGPIAKTFKEGGTSDTFENSKRLYLMARYRYEKEKAIDVYGMIKGGPSGVINPLMQRLVKEGQFRRIATVYQYFSRPRQLVKDFILEPTHFFGLIYDSDIAKECVKEGGLKEFMNKTIGEPLSKLWGVNRLKISLDGMDSFRLVGGGFLKGAVEAGNLLQGGSVSTDILTELFKAKNIEGLNALPLLNGLELSKEGIKDVKDLLKDLQELKKWFLENEEGKKIASLLGITFTGTGANAELVLSENAAKFFRFISMLKADPSSTDPTQMLVGRLKLFSQTLSKIQTGYIALIANIRKPIVYIKTLITDALTTTVMGYLDSVTGGLGEVLRLAVRFIINIAVDWGEKLIRAIMKFDLTEFMDEVTGFIMGGVKYVMYFILAPVIIILMLFDTTKTLFLGISPIDNSRTDGIPVESMCTPVSSFPEGANAKPLEEALEALTNTYMNPYNPNSGMSETNFRECYYAVLQAALDNNTDPALAAAIWVEESGASNYDSYPDVSDFGCVAREHNNFQEQLDCYVVLKNSYIGICSPLTTEDYLQVFSSGGCSDYGENPDFAEQINIMYEALHSSGDSLDLTKVLNASTVDFSK